MVITENEAKRLARAGSPPAGTSNGAPLPKSKSKNRKLSSWILGLVLSFLPILVEPIVMLLTNKDICIVLWTMLSNISIMYVGISMTVAAMNDLEPDESARANYYIIIVVVGVFFYSILSLLALDPEKTIDITRPTFFLNIVMLVVSLSCGLQQYLRNKQ